MRTTSELLGHLRTALSSEVTTDEAAAALVSVKDGIREIDQLRARIYELEFNDTTWSKLSQEQAKRIDDLEGMLVHFFVHSNYQDLGFNKLTTDEKITFCDILDAHGLDSNASRLRQFIDTTLKSNQ